MSYMWEENWYYSKDILNKNDFLIATSDAKLERVYKKNNIKVRDHCHFTRKFLGPAHNNCNLNRNYDRFKIPVFFIMEKVMMHIL